MGAIVKTYTLGRFEMVLDCLGSIILAAIYAGIALFRYREDAQPYAG
jgi:hypothetical protein